jgi:hypothetical protein
MNWLSRQSIEGNKESEGKWNVFETHRDKLLQLLRTPLNRSSLRLCVLGAGNCTDLDLHELLKTFHELHLVDLDHEALANGVRRQRLFDSPIVHRHGGIDVTGCLDEIASWSPTTPIAAEAVKSCAASFRTVLPMLPGPFDVVVSACLLSQLLRGVVMAIGESHPQFLDAIQAVRTGHLRLLAELVAPGGCGLLATDLVSSDTYPSLRFVPDENLSGVLARLVHERNFFHGLNPAIVASFFRTDLVGAAAISKAETIRPWRWDFGTRVYAVYAIRFFK